MQQNLHIGRVFVLGLVPSAIFKSCSHRCKGCLSFKRQGLHSETARKSEDLKYLFYFQADGRDNCFPLAVGSYNGGPHNMSRWYRSRMGTWNLDEFIEHIPYDETRRYIKKVTGYYAEYSLFYEKQSIRLPEAPLKDDPTVIDF